MDLRRFKPGNKVIDRAVHIGLLTSTAIGLFLLLAGWMWWK
jgi:hypothetical protein